MAMYRGLSTFISDIRNCKSRDAEQQRVDKELANVRVAFTSGKASSYDKKKYVWKLVYINMMGYDVDFGHMEMISLVSSPTYAEKLVGYMAVAVMLRNTDPQITLVVQAIKSDLQSTQVRAAERRARAARGRGAWGAGRAARPARPVRRAMHSPARATNARLRKPSGQRAMPPLAHHAPRSRGPRPQDPIQCLALCAIANIGGKELAEAVKDDVQRILFARSIFPVVRKKAALCLLRLSRISRELVPADEWGKKLTPLLEDKNMGVVLSVVTLLLGLAERDPAAYENCTGHLLVIMTRLAINKQVQEDYMYHSVASPWLQVRILRLIQCFPIPGMEAMRIRLNDLLMHIMSKTEVTKSVNRNNAEHCILFEAINLVMKQGDLSLPDLRAKAVAHLSKFINIREPNIRYLGLETMSRLVQMDGTGDAIRKMQGTVFFSLKDADISIRRRALDLLFCMCNREVAASIVKELLAALSLADWQIKDEMVLKTAILAERFAPDRRWYVDTIISLISLAGDHVADDVWHRLVQIVTNNEELHKYAASKMYHALEPVTAHETALKVGGYILGEFGHMLNDGDEDGGAPVGGAQQFAAVHQHFTKCGGATKCILLSAYCKMQNLYPELAPAIRPIFEAHTTVIDAELQQRAVEYLHLPDLPEAVTSAVLDVMPQFPERDSMLEAKLRKQQEEGQDKDAWGVHDKAAAAAPTDDEAEEGGEGSGASATASAPATAAAAAPAPPGGSGGGGGGGGGLDDLLGLSSAPAPAPPPPPAAETVPVTKRVTVDMGASPEQVKKWLTALQGKAAGVLFEDAHVQIGVKHRYGAAEGRVVLFIGNKSAATPLVALRVRVPERADGALRASVMQEGLPTSVAPKAQAQVTILVESLKPFAEPPALQLSFISEPGTGHAYLLSVPCSMAQFCEPAPTEGADFRAKWGALAGAPRDATGVAKPAGAQGAAAVSLEGAKRAVELLGFADVAAGAPGATGAGLLRTKSLNAQGLPISVPCFVMCIPDAAGSQFKIAVRSPVEAVSKGLLASLQAGLALL